MKTTLNLPQEIITSIDVMNTLNGGTSEPVVKLEQFATHRLITLYVPGIVLENIKVEINNNKLAIFGYTIITSQQKEMQYPKVLYNKSIPYFVDAANITASQEGKALLIKLPFNQFSNGYHRDISIN